MNDCHVLRTFPKPIIIKNSININVEFENVFYTWQSSISAIKNATMNIIENLIRITNIGSTSNNERSTYITEERRKK